MRVWLTALLAGMVLSGCSGDPSTSSQEASEEEIDYGVEATSTTGVIRGIVIDEAIRPLFNASVSLAGLNRTVVTNDDGAFGFEGLEPGTYFFAVSKLGFKGAQGSADVVAGVSDPAIVKVMLTSNPSTAPYVEVQAFRAFITCGAAIVATSVGCNTFPDVGEALGDKVYFLYKFTTLPMWTQGELVWEQTQPAGGAMIWEIVNPDQPAPQRHTGYRETAASPALAYINTTLLAENEEWVVGEDSPGLMYRIFAGPHPTCTGVGFGCGVTVNQQMDAYVHNFFNFVPPEGWRFTVDGPPVVPR